MASTTTARLRRQIVNERNGGANFLDKKKDMVRVQELRRRAEQLRSELVEQIDGQLNDLFDDVLQDVEDLETPNGHSFSPSRDKLNGTKVFVPRQSVLTELLEVNHIKTIYNIFVALLILFIFNTVVYDYIDKGSVQLDFSILRWAFGKTSTVISIWLVMKIMAISAFPLFFAWHANRHSWLRIPDAVWLILYITYQVIFAVFPVQEVCIHNLPPASSIIILLEQIRLMLKVHAFVRENAPKVLSIKPNPKTAVPVEGNQGSDGERTANTDTTNGEEQEHEQEHDVPQLPEFGQYLYFLFCPTLIYRDHYPMTPCIRWNYVVSNVFQVLMCIFYLYYVFARFCVPVFRNIGKEPWNYKNFTLSVFSCMLPGTMILVLGFFALLHSWLNAFAEMTRFADRMFYKDWWNSASYADYYRTWNVVVHDWLYAYIYKDCVKLIKNRQVATVLVFSMSAIVHEYVLMFAFRFCFPILLVMFGAIGLSFVFLKPKKSENVSQVWNVFMWITLIIGNGLLMCLYSQEWFAIQNCPRTSTSLLDQLVPRSWSVECLGKSLKLD